jgi:CxxC-x17-CxxC domain-containing protein
MSNYGRGDDRSRGGFRGGFNRGGDRGDRPMYKTVCSNCGKDCQVPFRPTNGKPVYCSECFEKMGPRRDDFPRPERPDFRPPAPPPGFDQNKAQFEALNVKLDKILNLLEVKEVAVVAPVPAPKVPKAKKVAKK